MTKQNQIIVALALLVIIVLGLGGYFLYGKNASKPAATTTEAPKPSSNNMMQSTIKDLFASGETKQCTFSVKATSGGLTEGRIYVSGTNASGKFTMTDTKGKQTSTNLIRNSDTFYIWGGDLPAGIKMSMNVDEMAQKMQSSPQTSNSFDPNAKVDFKCSPWTLDSSIFTPPTNVKFMDISAMMPKTTGTVAPSGTTGTKTDPCLGIADAASRIACEKAIQQQGY